MRDVVSDLIPSRQRKDDAHAPITIYQPVYPAVNEYGPATRYAAAPRERIIR